VDLDRRGADARFQLVEVGHGLLQNRRKPNGRF
jgi:hypothetical protein